jgi:uncharacterized protein (DUF2384 family)
MLSFGHLGSERRFMTARMEKRAVDFSEISFYRLKASLQAISHHSSERRFKTARVEKRAVDFSEISFKLLLVKT